MNIPHFLLTFLYFVLRLYIYVLCSIKIQNYLILCVFLNWTGWNSSSSAHIFYKLSERWVNKIFSFILFLRKRRQNKRTIMLQLSTVFIRLTLLSESYIGSGQLIIAVAPMREPPKERRCKQLLTIIVIVRLILSTFLSVCSPREYTMTSCAIEFPRHIPYVVRT